MNILKTKLRDLTMKNQILLANLVLLIISLILVTLCNYTETKIYYNMFSISSSQILEYQDLTKIANIAHHLQTIIENKFRTVIRQMEEVAYFYEYYTIHQSELTNNMPLESCLALDQFSMNLTFFSIPRFCYQAQGVSDFVTLPENDTELMQLHGFISLLNHYSLAIDVNFTWMIQIASVSSAKYYAHFPNNFIFPFLDITKAPWYLNHMEQIVENPEQKLVLAPLTTFFMTEIPELDISYSMLDKDTGIIQGIIREPLLITEYLIPKIPYNVMLLDIQGRVIYNRLENTISLNQTFYIFNENITGFDKTDWDKIQYFSDNHDSNDVLKLQNKAQNQLIHMYAVHIMQKNYTLLVYSNITSIIELDSESQYLKEKIIDTLINAVVMIILFWIILYSFQYGMLWIVVKPMQGLTSIVKNHVLSLGNNANREIQKMTQNKDDNNVITTLANKLMNISDIINESQQRKSEICKRWESLKYNKLDKHLDFRILKQAITQLDNNCQEAQKSIKSFLVINSELEYN